MDQAESVRFFAQTGLDTRTIVTLTTRAPFYIRSIYIHTSHMYTQGSRCFVDLVASVSNTFCFSLFHFSLYLLRVSNSGFIYRKYYTRTHAHTHIDYL